MQLDSWGAVHLHQLKQEGLHGRTAKRLLRDYPEARIRKQLEALSSKTEIKNRAGWLIRAVEDDYEQTGPATTSVLTSNHGSTFVAHYYAGYAGNSSTPTAEPSTREADQGQRYVERLLELWNDKSRIPEWGRQFGKEFRERQRFNEKGINAFTFALKSHGDDFFRGQESRKATALQTARNEARAAHRQRFESAWLKHTREADQRLREADAEAYAEFEENRDAERGSLERNTFFKPEQLTRQLEHFDSESRRLQDLVEFFAGDDQSPIVEFEDWDEQHNPDRFDEESVTL